MKTKYFKKRVLSGILCGLMAVTIMGCTASNKEITVSNDVKKEAKLQEKGSFNVKDLSEIPLEGKIYVPVCFKDDDNIIIAERTSNKILDVEQRPESNRIVYTLNLKTNEKVKLKSLKNIISMDGRNSKVIYTPDKKNLYEYDFKTNKELKLIDMTSTLEYIKKNSLLGFNKDYLLNTDSFSSGYVTGNEGIAYAEFSWTDNNGDNCQAVNFIDTKTEKVFKSDIYKNILTPAYVPGNSWIYSKAYDKFYTCSNRKLYQYDLQEINSLKELKGINNVYNLIDISEDGKELYLGYAEMGQDQLTYIATYNLVNSEVKKIINTTKESNVITNLSFLDNFKSVFYNTASFKKDIKTGETTNIKYNSFIGTMSSSGIKNIQRLPVETIKDKSYSTSIMANENRNKFIYFTYYYDYKHRTVVPFKTRMFLGEIK